MASLGGSAPGVVDGILSGIEPAAEGQVFSLDPSYVLEKDVYLSNQDLFYMAVTRVSPIEKMNKLGISLDRIIIIMDA